MPVTILITHRPNIRASTIRRTAVELSSFEQEGSANLTAPQATRFRLALLGRIRPTLIAHRPMQGAM